MIAIPAVEIDFSEAEETFLSELEDVGSMEVGVASVGEAASYALIWEFGNVRQTKKGPKTTLGVNRLTGEQVWLSIQAPTGYIRVNEDKYWRIIRDCLDEVELSGTTSQEIRAELEKAAYEIARQIADVIRETAPEDSGALKASILVLKPGDEMLDDEQDFENQVETLEFI